MVGDRVRYDSETSLYWMCVRAYDPTLGRFLSRDPLNRAPLVFTASRTCTRATTR